MLKSINAFYDGRKYNSRTELAKELKLKIVGMIDMRDVFEYAKSALTGQLLPYHFKIRVDSDGNWFITRKQHSGKRTNFHPMVGYHSLS